MARPQGEIRQALAAALTRIAEERGHANYREIACVAQVGYRAARVTLENMARAGQVRVAGHEKPAGTTCWHNLYEPIVLDGGQPEEPQAWGGIEALAGVVKDWAAAR